MAGAIISREAGCHPQADESLPRRTSYFHRSRTEEDTMGRIVVTEFISLDGVIEAPGGGEGYKHDGWTFEIDRGEDGNQFKLDETTSSAALLLGRRTFEGFAAAWPERDGEFADKFNAHAEVRRVVDAGRPAVVRLDRALGRCGRRSHQGEEGAGRRHRRTRQRPARADVDR